MSEERAEVWVVATVSGGEVDDASLELLREGRALSDRVGGLVAAVILGDTAEGAIPLFGRHGAQIVYLYDSPALDLHPDVCLPLLEAAVRERSPRIIVFPASRTMQILAARLGARLGVGVASECTKLDIASDGYLLVNRPAYGGRLSARVTCLSSPQIATFQAGYGKRGAVFCEPQVRRLETSMVGKRRSTLDGEFRDPPREMDLMSADVIVSGGKGVGGREGFALLERLAERLGGALAASRAAVDSGWVPAHRQVGLSGKTVAPRLYIACGISGATHHVVGMKDAKSIIAINNDRSAPIFKIADVAVLGDLHEVIPRLLNKLEDSGGHQEAAQMLRVSQGG
jgi:electron transfer flavoprotein alpha subunit